MGRIENNELESAYKQLFCDVCENGLKLSKFFPLEGENYRDSKNDVRVMFVGRCTNGWTIHNFKDMNFETFYSDSEMTFDWIGEDGKPRRQVFGSENQYIGYADEVDLTEQEEEYRYYRYPIGKSKFFNIVISVTQQLTDCQQNEWHKHIVWSNLYPISPELYGNAEGSLKKAQLGAARKVLEAQIAYYKPTHIVFVTGWSDWFEDFSNMEIFKLATVNKDVADKTETVLVTQGTACEGQVKVAVVNRPEGRNKPPVENYIKAIVDAFKAN
ncbi:MAG: hypothetical protein KBS54_04595 [Synergistaceae bacterium]|nr:hypothetical protein [Candidatus Equadaptatus faecalis]